MMKPKKTIVTRYITEEEQAKSRLKLVFHNSTATQRNNESRVDVNKNKKREVPDLMNDYTTYHMAAENLQLQKKLSDQEKKNTTYKMVTDTLQSENYCLQKRISDQEKMITTYKMAADTLQNEKYGLQKKNSNHEKMITAYKIAADTLQSEKDCLQKKKSVQEKKNTSLTLLLEMKQKEITKLNQLTGDLEKTLNDLQKMNTEMAKSSKISHKEIKSLTKEKEKLNKKITSLQCDIKKLKAQNIKHDKLLEKTRHVCKHNFNSKILPNFVQANSTLITDVVKLYESSFHGDKIQHCPAIQYMKSVPQPIVPSWHTEDFVSTHGPSAKRRKIDNSVKDINKHYSQSSLKVLVMNLEPRHSDTYELWRNVLWALNQYGCEQGYDTLEIADCFSKRSSKYKNLQDVKKTFESSHGTLSLQYLIEISKIYEEGLDALTKYLNDILPSKYLLLTVNQVDIRDRQKFRLSVNCADISQTLFIIPDLCVLTNEDGKRLSFLQKNITSRNSELATLCPEMEKGFNVTLKKKFYEFEARNNSSVTMKLYHPLKPAQSVIILHNGKQDNKESHLAKIQKVMRAEAIKLLSAKSGKEFGDDDDDNDMVIIPDKNLDSTRTEVELAEALFDTTPNIKNRYVYSGKTVYYCKSDTNLWCKLSEKAFEGHLRKHLKTSLQLSQAELRHIGKINAITKMRNITLGEIENIEFLDLLDSNLHLFITNNKTIVTSSIPLIVRNIEKEDLAETTCGWSYDYELSMKHMKSVRSYFEKLIPRQCEREWFLSFAAKMLNGQRNNEHFLVLTNKWENKKSILSLMYLLATVFGNYHIANTKIVVTGGIREIRDNNQHDGGIYNLKGKRLLVADKLQKIDTLNSDFIKAITGQSNYFIRDTMKFCRTQFKFPVQAGLIMTFTEDDVPKFDKNDQDFVERMVTIPMRSRFLSKQEYDELIKKGEKMTDIHIADDSLKHCPEWNSAVLDLLMDYYNKPLQPIPESMVDWKKKLCNENYDYYDWLDSHVYKDENNRAFITAMQIMRIIHKSQEYHHPYELKKLKFVMSEWAKKNDFSYKVRHVYMSPKKKRVEAKSVILNAGLHKINEERSGLI